MTIETIFRILTLGLTVTALTISGYYRRKAEHEAGELDKSEGQRLLVVLRLFGLVAILPLVGYWINPSWVAWARVELPTWLRGLAAVFAASMLPVFLAIFRAIGLNISPTQATRKAHRLVTTGPYRFVRHPALHGRVFIFSLPVIGIRLMVARPWPGPWDGPAPGQDPKRRGSFASCIRRAVRLLPGQDRAILAKSQAG